MLGRVAEVEVEGHDVIAAGVVEAEPDRLPETEVHRVVEDPDVAAPAGEGI